MDPLEQGDIAFAVESKAHALELGLKVEELQQMFAARSAQASEAQEVFLLLVAQRALP